MVSGQLIQPQHGQLDLLGSGLLIFQAVLEFPLYYVLLFTPGVMEVNEILTEMEYLSSLI